MKSPCPGSPERFPLVEPGRDVRPRRTRPAGAGSRLERRIPAPGGDVPAESRPAPRGVSEPGPSGGTFPVARPQIRGLAPAARAAF